jgi:hypothetical protein
MLEVLLALDRGANVGVALVVDELVDLVAPRVLAAAALLVLVDAERKVLGDADVECAAGPACQDVDSVGFHRGKDCRWNSAGQPLLSSPGLSR